MNETAIYKICHPFVCNNNNQHTSLLQLKNHFGSFPSKVSFKEYSIYKKHSIMYWYIVYIYLDTIFMSQRKV